MIELVLLLFSSTFFFIFFFLIYCPTKDTYYPTMHIKVKCRTCILLCMHVRAYVRWCFSCMHERIKVIFFFVLLLIKIIIVCDGLVRLFQHGVPNSLRLRKYIADHQRFLHRRLTVRKIRDSL